MDQSSEHRKKKQHETNKTELTVFGSDSLSGIRS
jgi:hypothetical protein